MLYSLKDISQKQHKRFESPLLSRKTELLNANETVGEAAQVVELDQTRVVRITARKARASELAVIVFPHAARCDLFGGVPMLHYFAL
jgi:hypothetical protein